MAFPLNTSQLQLLIKLSARHWYSVLRINTTLTFTDNKVIRKRVEVGRVVCL